jgi:hypothetical protein
MTEADARTLLRDCGGFGGLEAWITGRRWKAAPGGWTVTGELQGWQFRLDVIPAGLRISASAPGGGDPAVCVVTRERPARSGGAAADHQRDYLAQHEPVP